MKSKKFLSLLMALMMCAVLFAIPAAAENVTLENISATKSEITLDYSAEVTNGSFAILQGGVPIAVSVSKTNSGKTIVVTPNEALALDTVYVLHVTGVSDNGYYKAFKLETLFADDFESYTSVSDMDSVWNVSYRDFGKDYTVSGFNEYAGSNIYSLENGWLVIDGNKDNGAINIKSGDVSQWNNYTLELDVKRDSRYYLDIMYHMIRVNGKPGDFSNNFRLGIYGPSRADACFTTAQVNTATEWSVFTEQQHHLKLTTKTGKDLQVFKDGTNVLSQTYNNTLASYAPGGEIGFKATGNGQGKQYIDNILAYKLITFDEIPTAPELQNISATKSEVTMDYSEIVFDGDFTLTKDGAAVETSVSKTNGGKTVVITPKTELALDTVYELHASDIFDYAGGTTPAYDKPFMLKKLFADDFQSYTNVSDMDSVWNVSSTVLGKDYTVSGYNAHAGKDVYTLEDGWLAINGNYNKENGAINIKSDDVSQWNKYTLELDVKRDQGTPYYLDIMYHMVRTNGKPNDYTNNFRFGLWQNGRVQTFFTKGIVSNNSDVIFTKDSYHLKLTTKTGNDLQVYKDNEKALSYTYNLPLATYAAGGEIGFKVIGGDNKQYIDNIVAYKLLTFDEIPTAPELQNISATKSEVTMDYSEIVFDGDFTLTKDGAAVETSVSKTNGGKTVVITPKTELALDTVYELHASDIFDYAGGTTPAYDMPFMLQTLFADDFSYTSVAEMDKVWNVSDQNLDKDYSVSGFNTFAGKDVYTLENGRLAINGNYKNGAINIKAYDASQWNNYTLEVDIGKDAGKRWWLDILYNMYRNNKRPNDIRNNFRLGLDWNNNTGAAAYFLDCNDYGHKTETGVFTENSHHLKFTTTTGYDLQVFKDKENVFSHTYGRAFGNGEIGFKVLGGDTDKQYIDNVVAYKLVELDNTQNNIFVKEATVTETGVTGTYILEAYDASENANVIVAAYGESNKLLGMQIITDVTSQNGAFSFECNTPKNITYVKAYLWNSIGGMTPERLPGIKALKYHTYE